ncbi:MAG: CMP-N,N'-diacetyllegionaminic acid synthase [Alphaproteobacteria bacterium ADurb.Bin438]|nr:MAG: CMP-N,N'-diacetyllegionaminic acid synthase [Alphaproteobacteria bacterium ADurb.Bin438]
MKNIAIIPARGGSKRIPRKNIKEFFGKPMVGYAIETAFKSGVFDEVMVSTDDKEIADIALKFGAKVPFLRSIEASSDFATTFDVLKEVVLKYKEQGKEFESLCSIYPCVPFLKPETLKQAYKEFQGFDGLLPVCAYNHPIERALKIENQILKYNQPEYRLTRTQDLEKKYHDVGMFCFANIKVMLKEEKLVVDKIKAFVMDDKECQDIDNEQDFELAEIKYEILLKKGLI